MEQDLNPVTLQPAPDQHLSTETTLATNNTIISTETQDTASSTDLPPPTPSGPECTPMDESKTLKRPRV